MAPVVPAGVVHVIEVEETTTTLVHDEPPIVTVAPDPRDARSLPRDDRAASAAQVSAV